MRLVRKGRANAPEIDSNFDELFLNAQHRQHDIDAKTPGDSIGAEGEIRLVNDGGVTRITAKINGVWRSATLV